MNSREKKEQKKLKSTRQLMGITELTKSGIKTPQGELVFYLIRPDNLSVLPLEAIHGRIRALTELFKGSEDMHIMALDSRESFANNKVYFKERLEEETNPALRNMLLLDSAQLDAIQTSTASAREFAIVFTLNSQNKIGLETQLAEWELEIRNRGFQVRRAGEQDIKRLLAVYYQQDVTSDYFESENGSKDFIDFVAPGAVKFNVDNYILGNSFRTVLAVRGYPTSTEDMALLKNLGSKSGVTLHIYTRKVGIVDENRIIHNAENRNRMNQSGSNELRVNIEAEENLQDVAKLVSKMHKENEPLMHCAVFIELGAPTEQELRKLQNEVTAELIRAKIAVDRVMLRQQKGYKAVNPAGSNTFGTEYERVLPASSVANLFPFNYSGKTDPCGFYIGKDRYGTNVIVDLDRRAEDKTNANALILGNSGQGKSYLLKLLLINRLEAGKSVICLDPEHELEELCNNLGGCFVDLMSGKYIINPLEPKRWNIEGTDEKDIPDAFTQQSRLSQHISFLKDFFRAYKDFSDRHIDTIEIMLERMYAQHGITDDSDLSRLSSKGYPILADLYHTIESAYNNYGNEKNPLFTKELLQEVLLGLHSMCIGAESKFFNGHTNITSDRFLVFGVKHLVNGNVRVKDALLFNVLSYLSDKLLTEGNTVATLDELYIWLSSRMTIEYIRNMLKRVRKKDSSIIMASQNLEDFNVEGIRELTRPLFGIPTHQFIFNCGAVDKEFYKQNLQLEDSEYELIRYPQRGVCLYKCGVERFLLEVKAPEHKASLFGTAGGQ